RASPELEASSQTSPEAAERRERRGSGRKPGEGLAACAKAGAKSRDEGPSAREVAVDDRLPRRHDDLACSSPQKEGGPLVEAVLPRDVAAPPPGQTILGLGSLAERSRVRMNRERVRSEPTLPASCDAPDRKVDVFEVGEERRIEAADLEKCSAVECRSATAG